MEQTDEAPRLEHAMHDYGGDFEDDFCCAGPRHFPNFRHTHLKKVSASEKVCGQIPNLWTESSNRFPPGELRGGSR